MADGGQKNASSCAEMLFQEKNSGDSVSNVHTAKRELHRDRRRKSHDMDSIGYRESRDTILSGLSNDAMT